MERQPIMFNHTLFNNIDTFIFDVDGVLTNSNVLITESGELLRTMNVRDGQAIKIALAKGYRIAIITKGNSKGVKSRLLGLGIKDYFGAVDDKLSIYDTYIKTRQINPEQVLYMGDDIPDLVLFKRVGLSCCPSDASNEVLTKSEFVSHLKGGQGCVRDVIEKVMRIRGDWVY